MFIIQIIRRWLAERAFIRIARDCESSDYFTRY